MSGREWRSTRPKELGAEWELRDAPARFAATVAVDIDRESFLWAARWAPPAELAKPWIEETAEGPVYHPAIHPIKEHGREWTLEDARAAAEEAIDRIVAKVAELHLDEMARPPKSTDRKVKRR